MQVRAKKSTSYLMTPAHQVASKNSGNVLFPAGSTLRAVMSASRLNDEILTNPVTNGSPTCTTGSNSVKNALWQAGKFQTLRRTPAPPHGATPPPNTENHPRQDAVQHRVAWRLVGFLKRRPARSCELACIRCNLALLSILLIVLPIILLL